MQNSLPNLLKVTACAVALFGAISFAHAADKKVDPTGTWTWTAPGFRGGGGGGGGGGGQTRTNTLKLKLEGEKLTGTLSGGGGGRQGGGGQPRAIDIEDAKLNGDEVSFKVTREFQNNKMVAKYNGKISGDTIKGKMEFDRNGEPQSRDWEAKRKDEKSKEEKK